MQYVYSISCICVNKHIAGVSLSLCRSPAPISTFSYMYRISYFLTDWLRPHRPYITRSRSRRYIYIYKMHKSVFKNAEWIVLIMGTCHSSFFSVSSLRFLRFFSYSWLLKMQGSVTGAHIANNRNMPYRPVGHIWYRGDVMHIWCTHVSLTEPHTLRHALLGVGLAEKRMKETTTVRRAHRCRWNISIYSGYCNCAYRSSFGIGLLFNVEQEKKGHVLRWTSILSWPNFLCVAVNVLFYILYSRRMSMMWCIMICKSVGYSIRCALPWSVLRWTYSARTNNMDNMEGSGVRKRMG